MPTRSARVQVTVDRELEVALEGVDARRRSRSRLLRDLALRGAAAERAERAEREDARDHLMRIVRGETDYDPASAAQVHAQREASSG